MTHRWIKQAYFQGFDCETITFFKHLNIFEWIDIYGTVYKFLVEPYY